MISVGKIFGINQEPDRLAAGSIKNRNTIHRDGKTFHGPCQTVNRKIEQGRDEQRVGVTEFRIIDIDIHTDGVRWGPERANVLILRLERAGPKEEAGGGKDAPGDKLNYLGRSLKHRENHSFMKDH